MAPPAKRRKRNLVDSDEEENDEPQQQKQSAAATTTPRKNSLKNFLFSSPSSRAVDDEPASPSPIRKSTRSATIAASAGLSNGAAPSRSFLPNRVGARGGSKASTKSPSTSPEKRIKKGKFEEKGKSADLLTLFSKQAQRVKAGGSSQPSNTSAQCLDDILSDPISEDDDVAVTKASASSIVGSRAQKRFRDGHPWSSQPPASTAGGSAFGPPSTALPTSQFLKPPRLPSTTQPQRSAAACDDEQRPWSERFGPTNLDELAVHKKKVADVRRWLEDVLQGRLRQRLLILKGAAGSGKTTTVRLLAREMRAEILDWRNPTGSLGAIHGYQSASAQFEEFLGRGGKFGQLDTDSDEDVAPARQASASNSHGSCASTDGSSGPRFMLVEEFPNTFMRSSSALTSFRSTVLQYLAMNTPSLASFGLQPLREPVIPVVMIISETLLTTTSASADSFTAHRLLGPEILRHPGTGLIEFNAIAPSILAKALELVVQKEARKSGRRRTPGPAVLKRLGEIGDIRNAISSLEFLCLKGDADADWGAKVAFTKTKKSGARDVAMTKGERESLELVSQREASLGIFHAVGKVVYNKRDELPHPPGTVGHEAETLPDYIAHLSRPKPSLVSVDTLIDETGTDTSTFISALHENYVLSCEATGPRDPNSSVDYINGCIDALSESDLLCPSWDVFFGGRGGGSTAPRYGGRDLGSHVLRQDEMAFEVAVRGLLFSLPCPVKRQGTAGSGAGGPPGRNGGGNQFKMFFPTSIKLWRAKEELEGLIDMWVTKMLNGEYNNGGSGSGSSSGGSGANGTHRSSSSSLSVSLSRNSQQHSQQQKQSLTNGAAAFRRPGRTGTGTSSVGDWATNRTEMKYAGSFPSSSSSAAPLRPKAVVVVKKEPTDEEAEAPHATSSSSPPPPPPLLSLGASARKEMLLERLPYMAHMSRRRRGSFLSVGLRDLEKVVSFQGIGTQSAAGPGAGAGDDEDADVEDAAADQLLLPAEGGWATDKPTDETASPRKRRGLVGGIRSRTAAAAAGGGGGGGDATADALLGIGGLQVQKLVLSDDDIEDD